MSFQILWSFFSYSKVIVVKCQLCEIFCFIYYWIYSLNSSLCNFWNFNLVMVCNFIIVWHNPVVFLSSFVFFCNFYSSLSVRCYCNYFYYSPHVHYYLPSFFIIYPAFSFLSFRTLETLKAPHLRSIYGHLTTNTLWAFDFQKI